MKIENKLDWLIRKRTQDCPNCKPTKFPYSLVKTTQWCPKCERVWKFKYSNIEDSIKKAIRYWWYEDNPKEIHRIK